MTGSVYSQGVPQKHTLSPSHGANSGSSKSRTRGMGFITRSHCDVTGQLRDFTHFEGANVWHYLFGFSVTLSPGHCCTILWLWFEWNPTWSRIKDHVKHTCFCHSKEGVNVTCLRTNNHWMQRTQAYDKLQSMSLQIWHTPGPGVNQFLRIPFMVPRSGPSSG